MGLKRLIVLPVEKAFKLQRINWHFWGEHIPSKAWGPKGNHLIIVCTRLLMILLDKVFTKKLEKARIISLLKKVM